MRLVADQHDPALDLRRRFGDPAAQLGLGRALRRHDSDGVAGDRAVGGGRPGEHFADQAVLHGRHDEAGKPLVQPARTAEVPGLQMAVRESPFRHLLDRPFGGRLVVRRSGQARAVHIRQIVHGPHDLRVVAPFLADPGIDVVVDRFRRRRRNGRGDRARTTASAAVAVLDMKAPSGQSDDDSGVLINARGIVT